MAASGGTDAALALLARSPYGRALHPGLAVDDAVRGAGSVCLWHLRVLAGWLPPQGGGVVRVFAARFELANIADRLAALGGAEAPTPYVLGGLATAWPRFTALGSADDLRAALAASPWGDPGTTGWPGAAAALEARWGSWLGAVPGASGWAAGAAALLVARMLALGVDLPAAAIPDLRRQLGRGWEVATDLADLAARLPRAAAWVLADVGRTEDLWLAEGRWWQRIDRDAATTLRAGRPGPAVAAAAAARLVVDAWRVGAALQAAAWGGPGLEAFDAVA